MDAKKFFAAILFFSLFTAAADAKITEQQALGDQRIAPFTVQQYRPGQWQ